MRERDILLKVFVVEDDPDDRLLIQHDFAETNLPISLNFYDDGDEYQTVTQACSSNSNDSTPCLIVIDTFPLEKCIETLEQIRAATSDFPDIYIAGIIDASWEASFFDVDKLNMVGLIVKPLTPRTLVDFLKKAPEPALSSLDFSGYLSSV